MPFQPQSSRRDFFSGGFNSLMNKVAEVADIKQPLAFLGLDKSYTIIRREAMWTDFEILYGAYEPTIKRKAAFACLNEVNYLDSLLNIWQGDTELMKVNREAAEHPVEVSEPVYDFIASARRFHEITNGAFDITSTPLVRCWGFFTREPRVPSAEEIDEAKRTCGMEHVVLDEDAKTVSFTQPGIELTSASMGKGFALDRAVAKARERELPDILINGGYISIVASGAPAWKDHWQFDIRDPDAPDEPLARLRLKNQGFSTSGSELQKLEMDGHVYSHIIDPRSGYPAESLLNVSVVAPTATEAEALSTAFFVMGVEKTLEFCENRPDVGVIMLCSPDSAGNRELVVANLDESQLEVVKLS